jgi:hypothetical protein
MCAWLPRLLPLSIVMSCTAVSVSTFYPFLFHIRRDLQRQPSAILERWLKSAKKPIRTDSKSFLSEIVGDGDRHSPSMQTALQTLNAAGCLKA